jgi:ParB/RepB/Spo0J family partition protein
MSKTMTKVETSAHPDGARLAMIAIANVKPREGFNPRSKRDTSKYKQLRASIARRGIRQPLLVTPDPEHDGKFWIVAGEGRYLAALEEQLAEVPCLVDAVDPETDGLDDALVENLVREDLSPLDEARAFGRLRQGGLNVRGIAERIERPQKFVRERLALLDLPEALHEQIESGVIPLGAVPGLLALGKIHPELPAIGVRRVLDPPARSWDPRTTWEDLLADPVSVVIGITPEHHAQLPEGVYVAGLSYPVAGLPLDEKAQADLAKLGELQDIDIQSADVRFGPELVEQANALSAAFASKNGSEHLIVGIDVAGQLVGDHITRCLKNERARLRHENTAANRPTAAVAAAVATLARACRGRRATSSVASRPDASARKSRRPSGRRRRTTRCSASS